MLREEQEEELAKTKQANLQRAIQSQQLAKRLQGVSNSMALSAPKKAADPENETAQEFNPVAEDADEEFYARAKAAQEFDVARE